MSDKYDAEVERLRGLPVEAIQSEWFCDKQSRPKSPLFAYVTPSGASARRADLRECGCLTQVKSGDVAWTDELTEAIQADPRIPRDEEGITVDNLPVFAEWQRRIDKELGRSA